MTEKEKIEAYIANCKCCTLATCMKTCPTCIFNIGLFPTPETVEQPKTEIQNRQEPNGEKQLGTSS